MTSQNTPSTYKIAVDVGFYAFKAAAVWEDKIVTERVPAIVGVGETDNGLLSTGLVRQKKQMPDVIVVDDLRHLVGQHVNLYARPIERLDFDRLTFSPELRALWEQRPPTLYPEIKCPVLLLPARTDAANQDERAFLEAKRKAVAAAQQILADSETIWFNHTVHDVPLQRPRKLANTITRFVRENKLEWHAN